MSVRRDGSILRLEGDCRVEEAEALVALLQAGDVEAVDLTACARLHGALAQALLAFAIPVLGRPDDTFLRDFLVPALQAANAGQNETNTLEDGSGGRGPREDGAHR